MSYGHADLIQPRCPCGRPATVHEDGHHLCTICYIATITPGET